MDEPGEDMDNPVGLERTSTELRTNTPMRLALGAAPIPA